MSAAQAADSSEQRWPPELAIVAGRIDQLLENARRAPSIARRRFALDALARGLLAADPGAVSEAERAAAEALGVDRSTLLAARSERLPHAIAVPLVAEASDVAFVRQVHVTYDPGGLVTERMPLSATAQRRCTEAIERAARLAPAPAPVGHYRLVAAHPAALAGARIEGESLSAAAFVSAVALFAGRAARSDRVVTGALRGDAVVEVGGLSLKARATRDHGFETLIAPSASVAGAAAGEAPVLGVQTLEALVEAALEPLTRATRDPDAAAREAKSIARAGWRGYRWPAIREQLAAISGTLPSGRVELRVEVLARLAAAHRHCGEPGRCLFVLEQAEAIASSDEGRVAVPDGPLGQLHLQKAMTFRQLGRPIEAARSARSAVVVLRRARLRGELIKALGVAGLVALSRGRVQDAAVAFEEALSLTLRHQPNDTARSRAYLIDALGQAGDRDRVEEELAMCLGELRADDPREAWVRTTGAVARRALGDPSGARALLETEAIARSMSEEPLPGLLARRVFGLSLIELGEHARGYEVLAASVIAHGRALAPHLTFLAHLNVLYEARMRIVRGELGPDARGRARLALAFLPQHGELARQLARPLEDVHRQLSSGRRPRSVRAIDRLLSRCERLR